MLGVLSQQQGVALREILRRVDVNVYQSVYTRLKTSAVLPMLTNLDTHVLLFLSAEVREHAAAPLSH